MATPQERRSEPRFPCDLKAYCQADGEDWYPARIINCSFRGIGLILAVRFHRETILTLRTHEPHPKTGKICVLHRRQEGKVFYHGCSYVPGPESDVLSEALQKRFGNA